MIDVLQYDLNTPGGQQQAIQDIIDEHNTQYDQAQGYQSLNVIAFGVTVLTISGLDISNSNPLIVYNHNLGFEPLFMLFQGTMKSGGISEMPLIDSAITSDFLFVGQVKGLCDKSNIYAIWNDQLQTPQQSITYLVFDYPLLTT